MPPLRLHNDKTPCGLHEDCPYGAMLSGDGFSARLYILAELFAACGRTLSRRFFRRKLVRELPVLSRMHKRPYHQKHSQRYERYAQHLPEIHSISGDHFVFRRHLDVLDIFYQESRKENPDEEYSRDEPRAFLGVSLPVHPHQQGEKEEIAERLIEPG